LMLTFLSSVCRSSSAEDVFEKPVRLMADGKVIDTGEAWGHSSPCVEDIDGDGLKDLIVGDFGGKFSVYKNVGQPSAPVYKNVGRLKAGDADASVHIYCCVGGQPRFLDLDDDGIRDFISSSYDPGHCYYFHGLPDRKFAAGTELLDTAGVPVRSSPQQQENVQSFGSFYAPVDWDADGDIDVLIGCFDGELKLRINDGSSTQARFAVENKTVQAGNAPLKVAAHCCPVVADWDNDGRWDILSGCDDGSVTWFRNTGTKTEPRFEPGITLVNKNPGIGYDLLTWSDADIVPGIRSQIEVVDHNGDGKLDLLVGDFFTAYDPKPNLSDDERRELQTLAADMLAMNLRARARLEVLRKDFTARFSGDSARSEEAKQEWQKAYKALGDSPEAKDDDALEHQLTRTLRPLLASVRREGKESYDLAKSHGFVWLFLRK
jgi:FG-GAP-like repeat